MQTIERNGQLSDGVEMYSYTWAPQEPARAVICLVHGHGEHIHRYDHVGEAFAHAGLLLTGYDLRGHGRSGGKRGHTPSYERLLEDIADFLADARSRYPGLPVFLYGHSMGGNQVINYGLRYPESLKGMIVTDPWLRLAFEPTPTQLVLAKVMNNIMPSFSQPSGLEQAALSRDPAIVQAYATDPLVHDKISARLFTVMHANGLWALEHAAALKIPMLLMHGNADRLSSAKATQEFAAAAGDRVTLRIWDGFYHEIHNEPEKAQVIQVMIDWLNERL